MLSVMRANDEIIEVSSVALEGRSSNVKKKRLDLTFQLKMIHNLAKLLGLLLF
jgi:hypothetical protein